MSATADDKRFGTSLPLPIKRRIRGQAAATGMSITALLTSILDKALMTEDQIADAFRNGTGDERAS